MTNEEARQSILVYCVEGCGKLDSCRAECDTCIEALAIQALNKQIPKKPIPVETSDNEFICCVCPNCKEALGGEYENGEGRYCINCGQHLA